MCTPSTLETFTPGEHLGNAQGTDSHPSSQSVKLSLKPHQGFRSCSFATVTTPIAREILSTALEHSGAFLIWVWGWQRTGEELRGGQLLSYSHQGMQAEMQLKDRLDELSPAWRHPTPICSFCPWLQGTNTVTQVPGDIKSTW